MKQRLAFEYEAEIVGGLESMANGEIMGLRGGRAVIYGARQNAICFTFDGDPKALRGLKLAQAVYSVVTYDVPRPRALLGDAHFRRLIAQIDAVIGANRRGAFRSFHIAAAGSDSSVMTRIKDALARHTGLPHDDEGGDLHIRIITAREGWQTLVRLTPRPLATRAWRVQDMPGALNATVAAAMGLLSQLAIDQVVVNLGAGSASLLIERCGLLPVRAALGIDHDSDALAAARANIAAAGCGERIALIQGDMRRLPLPDACADALLCDLPFGQRVGSHAENARLYPAALGEAARIAKPRARFVVITHEIRLMEATLAGQGDWTPIMERPIVLRGLHPRIYVLERVV
jgi:23S rRNA G2445 N2-methylase RlmL